MVFFNLFVSGFFMLMIYSVVDCKFIGIDIV